jgi:hypothetical protein
MHIRLDLNQSQDDLKFVGNQSASRSATQQCGASLPPACSLRIAPVTGFERNVVQALQLHIIGHIVNFPELVDWRVLRNVYRLGDGVIDERLQHRLHMNVSADR